MKINLRFLIGRHPVDLLRLAMKSGLGGEKPLLVCMTEGRGLASMALGQSAAVDYPGIGGLLTGEVSKIARRVSCEGRPVDVVFPASAAFDTASRAEIIDRARERFDGGVDVAVLIDAARIAEDMPPLSEGDSVECHWELRDPIDPTSVTSFQALRTRLEHEGMGFSGIQLYARSAAAAEEAAERVAEIKEFSSICNEDVLVLDNEPAGTVASDPLPLEIVGVLSRRLIHDLGNELTCIVGNAQVGARGKIPEDQTVSVFTDIQNSAERLGKLVEELRDAREFVFSGLSEQSLASVRDTISSALPGKRRITLDVTLPGTVRVELRWIAFVAKTLIESTRDDGVVAMTTSNRAPGGRGESEGGFPVLQISAPGCVAPASALNRSAAEEYVRSLGGWIERSEENLLIALPLTTAQK